MLLGLLLPLAASAQDSPGEVYVVPITGTIDLGLAPFLERVLDEAADDGAAAVLLDIDTPGGRLDAVLQMQDALLGSEVRTIAYVDRNAFSAGALITIACEEIYMAPGAAMGAATPIEGTTGETASEKVISAVRKSFKATAEARGRDPIIAEAMVDPAVEVPGLVEEGKLLTLTTEEAIAWNYAEGVAATREDVLAATGLTGATIVETSPGFAERVVRFITDPIIASLLISLGMLLIIGDFLTEGLGVPALAGALMMATFFWGHLLAGLAGWEDLLLVLIGLILIAVELFVIPGFGIPGILGLAAVFGGFYLAMLGRDIRTPAQTERAALATGLAFIGVAVGVVLILVLLPRATRFGGLVLRANVGDAAPEVSQGRKPAGWLRWFGSASLPAEHHPVSVTAAPPPGRTASLAGASGVALTDLRPSGAATINGQRIDVVTDGAYIKAGEPIEVIRDEGYRRVVRRAET